MTRLQRILAIVLIVQVGLAAVVFWPRTTAGAGSGPLFTDLNTADIVKLAIEDNQGQQVELVRLGADWVLANSGDFPADGSKIEPILGKIAAIQTGRLVTQSSASHKRLQVADDDFLRRVEMAMKDGSVQTLFLGSAPNPRATHVRRAGEDETYLASDLASWELGAAAQSWIDASYVSLNRDEVTHLVVENPNGVFNFAKNEDATWTMTGLAEDETLNMDNFNPILNQAINMRMVAPLGLEAKSDYGLDDPQAMVSIRTTNSEDGGTKSYTLRIGAKLDETNYAVKWSDSPYYVSVAEFSLQNIINRTRDELVQVAEPATPEPEATPFEG